MRIKDQKGVEVIEFAIIFPLLIVFIFGIIEFSLILYDKVMITNASREGARSGILAIYNSSGTYTPLPIGDSSSPADNSTITGIVKAYCSNFLVSFSNNSVTVTELPYIENNGTAGLGSGDDRVIKVEYRYTFLVLPNFVTNLAGNIPLTATTTMRME